MIGSDPLFKVGEFVAVFNQSLEAAYPRVGIVGELANYRVSRNQWVYFDLRDNESSVKFFGTVLQLPGPLEDGLILEVYGRPRLHSNYGFSINIDQIRISGEGSIKKAQNLLAKKLESEGLFDPTRKRTLPFAPEKIGLITSAESAACGDFRKIIDNRWGRVSLQLIDVQVQGVDASGQVIKAIKQFNESADYPDVLAIVRGGGSPEDLAAFSDERVVRAVAGSRIPTVVAIGHEVDVSLVELASDIRASTPSNAAEIIVPDRVSERNMLDVWRSKIDEIVENRIGSEPDSINEYKAQIGDLILSKFDIEEQDLDHSRSLIGLLDPRAPLRRGYAIARSSNGATIRSVRNVKPGKYMNVSVIDGTMKTKVQEVERGKKD